jgi:hypothetical protein
VRDDIHERMANRAEIPPHEFRAVLAGGVVQRGQHDVERAEQLVRAVERAVRQDIHFEPVEDRQAGRRRAKSFDLLALPLQPVCADRP